MKRYFIIPLILLIITGILFLTTFVHNQAKPVLTAEEKIKKLNAYVNNSLYASENNMYLKIYSSNSLITIDELVNSKMRSHFVKQKAIFVTDN